jgi:hypothetical protein
MAAREAVPDVPRAFDGLSRDELDRMTETARLERREAIRARPMAWAISNIADAAGLRRAQIQRFRTNYLQGAAQSDPDCLPAPDPEINSDQIRQPGQFERQVRGVSPLWWRNTILDWLVKTGRVDEDFVPRAHGLKGQKRRGMWPPVAA